MRVKTKVGEIDGPDPGQVGPRTKFWAEALQDILKVEEYWAVLGAALGEAYGTGRIHGVAAFMQQKGEVINVEARVVEDGEENSGGATEGPEHSRPAADDQGVGPTQLDLDLEELPGSSDAISGF